MIMKHQISLLAEDLKKDTYLTTLLWRQGEHDREIGGLSVVQISDELPCDKHY